MTNQKTAPMLNKRGRLTASLLTSVLIFVAFMAATSSASHQLVLTASSLAYGFFVLTATKQRKHKDIAFWFILIALFAIISAANNDDLTVFYNSINVVFIYFGGITISIVTLLMKVRNYKVN